jgi:hypothetical protein
MPTQFGSALANGNQANTRDRPRCVTYTVVIDHHAQPVVDTNGNHTGARPGMFDDVIQCLLDNAEGGHFHRCRKRGQYLCPDLYVQRVPVRPRRLLQCRY